MQKKNVQYRLLLIILMLSLQPIAGCQSVDRTMQEDRDRGYYQNQALSPDVRDQIRESFYSVKRIQSRVIYKTYQMERLNGELPTIQDLEGADLEEVSTRATIDSHSSAGTAIVISIENRRALILTAAHVVSSPDTVYHFSGLSEEGYENRIEAVSVTQSRNQYIVTDSGVEVTEILAIDSQRDLALLRTVSDISDSDLQVFAIPMGNPAQLEWTDVVYAVGYPRGVQMVTRGIASKNSHPTRRITMDLSINRGFSGGPVFAVRNDGSGLEWVGNITSAMGEREVYLAPAARFSEEYNPGVPYEGELFVESAPRIYYGITHAVDVNEATQFIREHRLLLLENGFTRAIFSY